MLVSTIPPAWRARDAGRRLGVTAVSLALLASLLPGLPDGPLGAAPVRAATPVFINEIHYDNTGTDAGEAIEVAGPVGTDLAGYSIVLYNGNGGAVYDTDALSGTIPDQGGGMGTVVLTYPSNGIQNGAPDGMALVGSGDAVIQFLSYEGTFAAVGGPADGMTSTDIGVSETGSEPLGQSLQLAGVGTTYEDFTWASPQGETFGAPNAGQVFGEGNAPVISNCGGPLVVALSFGGSRTVTASDADGTVMSIEIADISPPSEAISIGATTPAGGPGETASAVVSVADSAALGTYQVTIVATNDDPEPQSGECTLSVTVGPVRAIGEVQGAVGDGDNGATHASPFAGQGNIFIRGVVTQRGRFPTSSGGQNYGFWVQSRLGAEDGDEQTSDGIFVFIGGFATVLRDGGGPTWFPVVGDQVVLRGSISEFFNLTELTSPRLVALEETGLDIGAEILTSEAQPPDDLADANRYWERREGMRFSLPAGAQVVAARDVFGSTQDAEMWVIRGDHPIAQRESPFERLVYRDPHPLDDIGPAGSFDNGNGMRIMLQSHGLKWLASSNATLIAPANTYDTISNPLTGALYFAFSKYGIEVEQQPDLAPGADPAQNAPPSPATAGEEFASSDYNVENLYDYRDDPFDGCDFTGNPGCPGVNPPFDYVPASEEAYANHLADLAAQIAGPMQAPDLLMIQETEDQDICWVADGSLACDLSGDPGTDDADGKPDTLQELALVISAGGGPTYDTAYDRDGADDRGIVSAFLYRTDTVELLAADPADPVLGSAPAVDYRGDPLAYNADVQNPKVLNADLPDDVDNSTGQDGPNVYTRPPQVGHFRVWRDGIGESVFTDLYALSNHFSSTPNARVGQRTEQALYNAAIVAALDAAGVDRVISAGDFNVYPRPDDPFAPGEPYGCCSVGPSDQLGPMYDVALGDGAGLHNLYATLIAEVPASSYSYSFNGMAQTLDMQWATSGQFADLVQVRAAHLNADFAADFDGDVARGASDHDPQLARWFTDVTFDRLHALVDHYLAIGDLSAEGAVLLHERLDRAERFAAAGQLAAARAQLRALGKEARDYAAPYAADALGKEGRRLASQL